MAKDEKKDAVQEDTRALKEAMSFVIGKRMPLPKNWTGGELEKLEFPNDLSMLSIDELGALMGIWSTVMAYAQYEVARLDIDKTARWNRYEFARKKEYLYLVELGGMTEEQRKSEVYVNTAQLRADYEVAKAKYVLTNALLGVYSKYYQVLSRELSRRGLDGVERAPKDNYDDDDMIDLEDGKDRLTKQWLAVEEEPTQDDDE